MGDADAAVDGESSGQVLVELAEPRAIDLVDQLCHPNDLWSRGGTAGVSGPCVGDRVMSVCWGQHCVHGLRAGLCPSSRDSAVPVGWRQDDTHILGTVLYPGAGIGSCPGTVLCSCVGRQDHAQMQGT